MGLKWCEVDKSGDNSLKFRITFKKKSMFIGEYRHKVDEKGRLAIPTKFRDRLSHGAVVTKGLDGCLFLYPISEWDQLAEKISTLPMSQANTRSFARLMLAGAMDVALDKQGRVILPDYLRQYAHIAKEVVISGLYNRLEIWDQGAWETYKQSMEAQSESVAEALGVVI